jgi:hypothetical protein
MVSDLCSVKLRTKWSARFSAYFGQGHDERSPMGGMLDSAERYALCAEPAEKRRPGEPTLGPDGKTRVARGVRLEHLDARPTAEVRVQARNEPNYEAAFARAATKKVLDAVARSSAQSRAALEMLFGDSGWRCAQAKAGSREDALFPLCGSYQRWLEGQRRRSQLELTDQQRIENSVAENVNLGVKRMVAEARVEAARIAEAAWDVVFEVVLGTGEKDAE